MRGIYLNGMIVAEQDAKVSVFDRGLNYGDGVFETIKAVGTEPVFLEEHMERLKTGAGQIGIKGTLLKGLFSDIRNNAIQDLLDINRLARTESSVKIIVTRGIDLNGYMPKPRQRPTTIIITRPIDMGLVRRRQRNGIKACVLKGVRPQMPIIKSLNYLPNILGRVEASEKGAQEGIFIDEKGMVLEGTSTNIFAFSNLVLKTPALNAGILPGVTRGVVIRLSRQMGLPVKEAGLPLKELLRSDEAFVTNSILGIAPISSIEGVCLGNGLGAVLPKRLSTALQRALDTLTKAKICR